MKLLLCFSTVILALVVDCDESIKNTNLKAGVYYYFKENSGKVLRWDGNSFANGKGLTYADDSIIDSTDDDQSRDCYLFKLENVINNYVRVKNKYTNLYISYNKDNNKASLAGFYLSNDNLNTQSIGLVIDPQTESIELYSPLSSEYNCMSNNSQYNYSSLSYAISVYKNCSTYNAKFSLIEAKNYNKVETRDPDIIEGTNLKFGEKYFIQPYSSLTNNKRFLRFDGNIITKTDITGNGLTYVINENINTPNKHNIKNIDYYLFEIVRAIGNQIKFKNTHTNTFVSVLQANDSANTACTHKYDQYGRYVCVPNQIYVVILSNNTNNLINDFSLRPHASKESFSLYNINSKYLSNSSYLLTDLGVYIVELAPLDNLNGFVFVKYQDSDKKSKRSKSKTIISGDFIETFDKNSQIEIKTSTKDQIVNQGIKSNVNLCAKIRSAIYENADNGVIESKMTKLQLIPKKIINNTKNVNIVHHVVYKRNVSESIYWRYYNITSLNLTIEEDITFPSIVEESYGFNSDNKHNIRLKSDDPQTKLSYHFEYMIDQKLTIPAQNNITYTSYFNIVKNLGLKFKSNAMIESCDQINKLSGPEIFDILKTYGNYTVLNTADKYIELEIGGELVVNLILGNICIIN